MQESALEIWMMFGGLASSSLSTVIFISYTNGFISLACVTFKSL